MRLKIDVTEREWKNLEFGRKENKALAFNCEIRFANEEYSKEK
jgi:hypothetical protein